LTPGTARLRIGGCIIVRPLNATTSNSAESPKNMIEDTREQKACQGGRDHPCHELSTPDRALRARKRCSA
jgi:hypothetical protein